MDERRHWPVPGNCQACPSPSNISRSQPLFGNCMPGGTFRPMGQSPAIGPAAWTPPSVPGQVTGVVAAEFSILYYATAAWRRVPVAPARARTFSYHRKDGLLAILYAILATAVIELAALELLLRPHHLAANVSCNGPGRDAIAD